MRQILIEKNEAIEKLSDDKIIIKSNDKILSEISANGVTLVKFPLKMNVVTGGDINLKFELTQEAVKKGILLLGAFYEDGEIEAAFMSPFSHSIVVKNNTPILKGTLIETVRYRQIASSDKEGIKVVGSRPDIKISKPKKKIK